MAILGKIRQRVGLLIFVIAGAILAFILMDVTSSSQGSGADPNVIGTIDGEKVNMIEYNGLIENITNNYQNSGLKVDDRTRMQIREQAWNQHVENKLAEKEFKKLGLTVTQDELKQLFTDDTNLHPTIKNTSIFQDENGQFSRIKFNQYIKSFSDGSPEAAQRRATWKNFERSLVKEETRNKYTNLVEKSIYVPKVLAEQSHADKEKKADISYVFIPYTNIDDAAIEVTDSDLSAYVNDHKYEFSQEATRSMEYVAFPIEASESDKKSIEASIQSQINNFRNSKRLSSKDNTLKSLTTGVLLPNNS